MNQTINVENPDFKPPEFTNKKLFNDFKVWIEKYPQLKEQVRIYLNTKEIEDVEEAKASAEEAQGAIDVQHSGTSTSDSMAQPVPEEKDQVNEV